MQAALGRLRLEFAGKIHFEARDFPLRDLTLRAAEAVRCAADQGKGEEMRHMVFSGQQGWAASGAPDPIWTGYARGLSLDMEKWGSCVRSGVHQKAIVADRDLGIRMGVDATPTIFIGRQRMNGAAAYEKLAEVFRAELRGN